MQGLPGPQFVGAAPDCLPSGQMLEASNPGASRSWHSLLVRLVLQLGAGWDLKIGFPYLPGTVQRFSSKALASSGKPQIRNLQIVYEPQGCSR